MHIIEYPGIPLNTPVYGGMNHDAELKVHASVFPGTHNGFAVEFHSREGIALHINPRMGMYGQDNVIVVNSMKHGKWQREERHHNILHLNEHFHLQVENHHKHYSIHINGQHICHFHHRESPHHIHSLCVTGDIQVQKIHFENFHGMNGGGVQIGGGSAPGVVMAPAPPPVVYSSAPAPVVYAPPPPPAVVIAPQPRPMVEVVVPRRPIVEVVVPRRPIVEVIAPRRPPVVVIERGGHHHHHRRHC